jgi:hypothetical protein
MYVPNEYERSQTNTGKWWHSRPVSRFPTPMVFFLKCRFTVGHMWAVDMIKAKQVSLGSCQRDPSIFVGGNEGGGGGYERATQSTRPATVRSRPRLNEVSRPARSVVNGVSRSDGPVRIVCHAHRGDFNEDRGQLAHFLCCLSLQCHYRGLLYF